MDRLLLIMSFIASTACAYSSGSQTAKSEAYELIFKKYKNDASAGTCKVTAEVRQRLSNGKIVRYTLRSEKSNCTEAEEDIRKGYEALKKQ